MLAKLERTQNNAKQKQRQTQNQWEAHQTMDQQQQNHRLRSGGSVVVDSLFLVAPIVCGCSVFGPYFVMQYLVSILVLQSSSRGRENWLFYLTYLLDVM